jgi:hypothetical protein
LKPAFAFLIACVPAVITAQAFAAEPVVRMKARLAAFDGQVMNLETKGGALAVSVLPQTRYVRSDQAAFNTLKPGDYAGAAVSEQNGRLRAQDVYAYAPALRGTGEGRFPEAGRLIINGTVSAASTDAKQTGTLTLHYRGAMLNGLGGGRTLCEGRASPPAYASALACEADASIEVPPGTAVSALTMGDKSLLVPGRMVTVAMTKDDNGKNITPGVIVEVPPPVPVEKPQSPK